VLFCGPSHWQNVNPNPNPNPSPWHFANPNSCCSAAGNND